MNRKEIYNKYMAWVDQVSEDLEHKTHFTPMEIVNKICDIIEAQGSKEKRYDDKYTPPFRVGRKQGKAVLDSKGIEVVFFNNSKEQAQLYCDYLNNK